MSSDLKSLQGRAPHQEELIKSLSGPSFPSCHLRDTDDDGWMELWKVAWDRDPDLLNGTEKVERSSDPIDDSLVGVVPTDCDVMLKPEVTMNLWYLKPKCKKILIRSEYREAEQFVLSACGAAMASDVLVVTGQPGIGCYGWCCRDDLRVPGAPAPPGGETH